MRGRLAVLLSGLLVLSCGRGGHGPTEPAAVPQVEGIWAGGWAPEGSPVGLGATMILTQNGSAISGSFSVGVFGASSSIGGTVDGNLKVHWKGTGSGCSSLTGEGTANGLNPTEIEGTVDFNSTGCGGSDLKGPVIWTKRSSAAVAR
jgi:hypothetical protein